VPGLYRKIDGSSFRAKIAFWDFECRMFDFEFIGEQRTRNQEPGIKRQR
jgi:hypothetical protein